LLGFFVERIHRLPALSAVVLALWCLTLTIICVRSAIVPHKNTVFATYELAGLHWRTAQKIYTNVGGFVYSPLVAALFAPFSLVPDALGNLLWRLLNVFVFVVGVWWWLRREMHARIPRSRYGLVFLGLLPLSIGNFNNGQVNPMVIGLLMIAMVAARSARWWLAAICIALTTYLKIYPLVFGLLLCAMFPRQFAWRLLVALVCMGGLAFLLQRPTYVIEQYQAWCSTRLHDNRHLYELAVAPRDLWRLLNELHLSITASAYKVLQVVTGALIAIYAVIGRWGKRPLNQLLADVFTLASCWMLLLGPASESATYVMLAPAVMLAFVRELGSKSSWWLRIWLFSALTLLVVALGVYSFTHANRNPHMMVIQPVAAVLFSIFSLLQMVRARSHTASWANAQLESDPVRPWEAYLPHE
jgi:hypothetical protein